MRSFGLPAALCLGTAGFALSLYSIGLTILYREANARIALVCVIIFIIATPGATAFGRYFLGVDQAFSGRYLTPSCIFWAVQIIYVSSLARSAAKKRLHLSFLVAISSVAVLGATRAHFEARRYASINFRNANLASDALLSGVDIPSAMELVDENAEDPKQRAQFLREEQLSIFSLPVARLSGRKLREAFEQIDDRSCVGAFEQAQVPRESAGVAVAGWGWDRLRQREQTESFN